VRIRREHAPHDEVAEVVTVGRHADVDDPLDLERGDREPSSDVVGRRPRVDVLAQP
jgi:hypothetical protein